MRVIDSAGVDAALDFPALVEAIDSALRAEIVVPVRHHHAIARIDGQATHLIMPAWSAGSSGLIGVKIVNVFPGNGARHLPTVMGTYLLMNGDTGSPLAVLDGARLTLWRTAAASALAARYLARHDAATHLMVGAGALAPFFISAHRAFRPIQRTLLWNKTRANADRLAKNLASKGVMVEVVTDLETATQAADIISTATLSTEPLIRGDWLKRGVHLDCVGAFSATMRETDDAAVTRARLFADVRASVLKEGGDFVQPLQAGLISESKIEADLFDLARGAVAIQRHNDDITFYKSTGSAIFDLAAAALVAKENGLAV
ncbi:COG2423 Predicted ornithine cyclodeaminase, mu-crystallin homolog [Rhabdaerophilaceae bacterium]